jgi:hypothetical protein
MTTATVMDDKPLTMTEAWRVYDRLYDEDHVMFIAETPEGGLWSGDLWSDATGTLLEVVSRPPLF